MNPEIALRGGTYSFMRTCCGKGPLLSTHEDNTITLACRVCGKSFSGIGKLPFDQWNSSETPAPKTENHLQHEN